MPPMYYTVIHQYMGQVPYYTLLVRCTNAKNYEKYGPLMAIFVEFE